MGSFCPKLRYFTDRNGPKGGPHENGKYNNNSQIKFKTSTLKSSLRDYGDAYILVSGTTTFAGVGGDDAAIAVDRNNKQAMFKNCAPFTDCITELNSAKVANKRNLDVVLPIYSFIEYSDNSSNTSGSLYQLCRDKPNNIMTDSKSFKFKSKFLDNTINGIINAKIAVPLKY